MSFACTHRNEYDHNDSFLFDYHIPLECWQGDSFHAVTVFLLIVIFLIVSDRIWRCRFAWIMSEWDIILFCLGHESCLGGTGWIPCPIIKCRRHCIIINPLWYNCKSCKLGPMVQKLYCFTFSIFYCHIPSKLLS